MAKVLNTVEKLSRDGVDKVALLSKSIDASTVANAELNQNLVCTFANTFANKDTESKKFALDLLKVQFSKRERSDGGDTDDDAGVKSPVGKEPKRN